MDLKRERVYLSQNNLQFVNHGATYAFVDSIPKCVLIPPSMGCFTALLAYLQCKG